MNLSGRTVLLTGATGGIGQATARALAARGAKLVLTGRRAELLEPLADETGGRSVPCDLSDVSAVERLIADAGDVDVLIANAALPASGLLDDFARDELDRALDVNLRVPIILARELMVGMKERGEGHLVFVSSLLGKAPSPGTSLYAATKAGMRGFALALREELHDSGVGVSTIFPGFIRDAGMFVESGAELPSYVGTKTPDDVATAIARAIERNRGEIAVAPVTVRAGAVVAGLVPEVAARVQRKLGAHDLSASIAAGQKSKR